MQPAQLSKTEAGVVVQNLYAMSANGGVVIENWATTPVKFSVQADNDRQPHLDCILDPGTWSPYWFPGAKYFNVSFSDFNGRWLHYTLEARTFAAHELPTPANSPKFYFSYHQYGFGDETRDIVLYRSR